MLDALPPRHGLRGPTLTWAIACAVGFVLLAAAVALGWTDGLDRAGRPATAWAGAHGLAPTLRFVEVAFARTAVSLYVVVLATALLVLREVRAAMLTILTTVVTTVGVTVLKTAFGRDRPPWQVADHLLGSASYPSGHASSAAALTATIVLVVTYLGSRRAYAVAAVAGAVLIDLLVAADRVLLGRHYPSDVLGGTLLGTGIACLAGVLVLQPKVKLDSLTI